MSKIALVFPGQGAQIVGMGKELWQGCLPAKQVFEEADEVLGISLSKLCFEGPEEELSQTINTQPAIMAVSIACLRAFGNGNYIEPVFVAGHSLGEYTALVAAKVLDFPDAVRLVRERGRLMQEAGKEQPGGMAAIIGLDMLSVEAICQETGVQIANINSPGQIVISGKKDGLVRAMDLARSSGAKRILPLKVGGAFHSDLMRPTEKGLIEAVSQFAFRDPAIPIVANVSARPEKTAEEVKEGILSQLCNPVLWLGSVEFMIEEGVDTFLEIGPGQVLAGLISRINSDVEVVSISDLSGLDSIGMLNL